MVACLVNRSFFAPKPNGNACHAGQDFQKKKKKRLGYLKLTLRALRTALLIGYALIITQQYDSTLIVIFNLTLIFYDVCNFRYVFYRLNKIIIINIILLLPNP